VPLGGNGCPETRRQNVSARSTWVASSVVEGGFALILVMSKGSPGLPERGSRRG